MAFQRFENHAKSVFLCALNAETSCLISVHAQIFLSCFRCVSALLCLAAEG